MHMTDSTIRPYCATYVLAHGLRSRQRLAHMVPLNQPAPALDLLSRVISGQPFDTPTDSDSDVDELSRIIPNFEIQ